MNQEQNNLNPNNFNTQGNNGITNNQPLNKQSFNSKPPKKMNLGLIIGIVTSVAVVGVGIVFGSKLLSKDNNNNSNSTQNSNSINNNPQNNNNDSQISDKTITDYSWKDFVISIDNHIITMGKKVNSIETYGFVSTSRNYDTILSTGQGLNTEMQYKGKNGDNIVFYPRVYNAYDTPKAVKETEMSSFELDINFIKNIDVRLPGGILLTENTTIDEIVNSMGNYTKNIVGGYYWEDEKYSQISVHFNTEGKLSTIQYSYNVSLNMNK